MSSSKLNLLGLYYKGKVILIGDEIDNYGPYGLIIKAIDAGKETSKKAELLASRGNTLVEEFTRLELGMALGKNSVSLIAIKNKKAARAYLDKERS